MQKKYKNKNMILLALTNESVVTVGPFVKKNAINYIVGTETSKTAEAFGIKGFPTIYVIDAKGKVVYDGHDAKAAEKSLEKLLKELPPDSSDAGLQEAAANGAYESALAVYKKRDYAKAMKAFEEIVKEYKSTRAATKAAAKIKSMKANKKIMAKVRDAEAKKKCEGWLDAARMLVKNGKREEAAEYYQKVIDEYPESSYADIARKENEAM